MGFGYIGADRVLAINVERAQTKLFVFGGEGTLTSAKLPIEIFSFSSLQSIAVHVRPLQSTSRNFAGRSPAHSDFLHVWIVPDPLNSHVQHRPREFDFQFHLPIDVEED